MSLCDLLPINDDVGERRSAGYDKQHDNLAFGMMMIWMMMGGGALVSLFYPGGGGGLLAMLGAAGFLTSLCAMIYCPIFACFVSPCRERRACNSDDTDDSSDDQSSDRDDHSSERDDRGGGGDDNCQLSASDAEQPSDVDDVDDDDAQ